MSIEVRLKPGEHFEKMLKRFIKKVKKHAIIEEYVQKTMFHMTKSQKKRAKRAKNKFLRMKEARKYANEY